MDQTSELYVLKHTVHIIGKTEYDHMQDKSPQLKTLNESFACLYVGFDFLVTMLSQPVAFSDCASCRPLNT